MMAKMQYFSDSAVIFEEARKQNQSWELNPPDKHTIYACIVTEFGFSWWKAEGVQWFTIHPSSVPKHIRLTQGLL